MKPDIDDDRPLSRTKKKQQAQDVMELAQQLCELSESRFARMKLPPETLTEAQAVRETRGRGSYKRQLKYLAGLLREAPAAVAALQDQLGGMDQVNRNDKKQFHVIESLRDRLCDPKQFEQACVDLRASGSQLDIKTIMRLAQSVHEHEDRRAYREIFKRLRDEMADPDA